MRPVEGCSDEQLKEEYRLSIREGNLSRMVDCQMEAEERGMNLIERNANEEAWAS